MKRLILLSLTLILMFTVNVSAIEIQLAGGYGKYLKANDMFKSLYGNTATSFGLETSFYFFKFSGFYLNGTYVTASGESSFQKVPISYNEIHLSGGLKLRLTILEFAPMKELNFYIKGGGTYFNYSEQFEDKYQGNLFGFEIGGGLSLWLGRFGVGIEAVQSIAAKSLEIQGMDIFEDVSFNGLNVSIKGILRL